LQIIFGIFSIKNKKYKIMGLQLSQFLKNFWLKNTQQASIMAEDTNGCQCITVSLKIP
jgi:hypothetical protein